METYTKVSVPGLTLEMIREKFLVGEGFIDRWEMPTRKREPKQYAARTLFPINTVSGDFAGVWWDVEASEVIGYNWEMGENRCEGWPKFVTFVESLVESSLITEATLTERNDEGFEWIRRFRNGEWRNIIRWEEDFPA